MANARIYIGLKYESLRRSEDMLCSGEEWFAAAKALPHNSKGDFAYSDPKVWSKLHSGKAGFAAANQKAHLINISLHSDKASFTMADQKM